MKTTALDLILGDAWAIQPEALEQILAIAQRLNDSPEAVAAKLGRPLENTRRATARDGSAIIPVTGPIFRRANLFTEISGATSVEVLASDIQAALDDPAIVRLVLEIDSPGGQATGIAELAAMIRASAKPVIAYVDGMGASAAYWLAVAAHELVLSSTALVGSIGVVASYRPERDGPIKVISSQSPLKQATPDTAEGRAEVQRVIDRIASIFIADVARYRGVSTETVLADFGQGGVLVGEDAVAVGMATRLGTFEQFFQSAGRAGPRMERSMSYQADLNTALGLPADASAEDAIVEISGQNEQVAKAARIEAKHDGETGERARVSAILAAIEEKPHAAATAHAAITAGLSLDQAQAMIAAVPEAAVLETIDEDRARAAYRRDFLAEGGPAAPTADSATGDATADTGADPEAAARHAWDGDARLRAEFANDFDRYQAFQKATASGRVKILRHARADSLNPSAA
jgi:ClpP class serine protease